MLRFAVFTAVALGAAAPALAGSRVLVEQVPFPEGPVLIEGRLHYVEYASGRVMAWDGTGPQVIWEDPGCGPSAVYPFQSDLIVTCYDSGAIARITPAGQLVAMITADRDGNPMVGPNDITSDGRGGVYFTASGPWETDPIVGKVYHMPLEGIPRPVADDLHYANGLALMPSGERLLVAESEAGRIVSFAVGADGALSDRRLFLRVVAVDPESGPFAYPDGLEFGPDDVLYIGQYSSGRIVAVTTEATLVRVIEVEALAAPNLTFRRDGLGLYVMAVDQSEAPYHGRIWEIDLD